MKSAPKLLAYIDPSPIYLVLTHLWMYVAPIPIQQEFVKILKSFESFFFPLFFLFFLNFFLKKINPPDYKFVSYIIHIGSPWLFMYSVSMLSFIIE